MLILQNSEAVNSKLRDLCLGEVDLDGDALKEHVYTYLLGVVGCNPIRSVKDEEELQARMKSLTPSQMEAFQLMINSSQQQLLFVTGPGGTRKSFEPYCSWSSHPLSGKIC